MAFHAVSWKEDSIDEPAITKASFKKRAASAFAGTRLKRMRIKRAALQGELSIDDEKSGLILSVRVDIHDLDFPVTTSLAASSNMGDGDGVASMVDKGLKEIAEALQELFRLLEATPKAWIRGLASSEADVQMLCCRLLGREKVKSAIEPLSALLSDPREPVAEAAAEALKSIGDKTAVPLIIKSIKRYDLRSEVRAIEIIGVLGGKEAEAYLEMVAVGHEVAEVRSVSGRLLERLRGKKAR
jgi:hypothetical protein